MIWSIDSYIYNERDHLDRVLFPSVLNRSIIVTNEHEMIVGVSRDWVKMCGFKSEDAFGKTPRILQGKHTNKTVAQVFTSEIRNGQFARAVLLNYKKKCCAIVP